MSTPASTVFAMVFQAAHPLTCCSSDFLLLSSLLFVIPGKTRYVPVFALSLLWLGKLLSQILTQPALSCQVFPQMSPSLGNLSLLYLHLTPHHPPPPMPSPGLNFSIAISQSSIHVFCFYDLLIYTFYFWSTPLCLCYKHLQNMGAVPGIGGHHRICDGWQVNSSSSRALVAGTHRALTQK